MTSDTVVGGLPGFSLRHLVPTFAVYLKKAPLYAMVPVLAAHLYCTEGVVLCFSHDAVFQCVAVSAGLLSCQDVKSSSNLVHFW